MIRYAAVILAAGLGSRFAASDGRWPSKLVAPLAGVPLVRLVALAARAASADPVLAVTGHAAAAVEEALGGLAVTIVRNPAFRLGLASSLKAGIAALPDGVAGAVVLLGDMPLVDPDLITRLVATARSDPSLDAVVPEVEGRRGNPVLLARSLFPAIARLDGDSGARSLLRRPGLRVRDIPPGAVDIAYDVDEASDLARPPPGV